MEKNSPQSPPDEKNLDEFIEKLAKTIVDRSMAAPAIMVLESAKPFTLLGSQTIVFFQPFLSMFEMFNGYNMFIDLLEDRHKVEKLIVAIENYEDEKIHREKVNKDEKRGN